jgi:hypothetical protein
MLDLGHEGTTVSPQLASPEAKLSANLEKPQAVFTIIVTGSRGWWHWPSVQQPLDNLLRKHGRLLIRNGRARYGLDALVHRWTVEHEAQGAMEDPHWADWDRFGRAEAGRIRNQRMVDEGADLLLVWALPCRKRTPWCPPGEHPTHGTADCVRRARDAGIVPKFCPMGMSWAA